MRRLTLMLAVSVSVLVSGMAVASVMVGSGKTPHANAGGVSNHHDTTDEAGVHGEPIARFHGSGCSLTNISAFQGNWTHGDYVSAVAVTGDSMLIVEAAHSACGKPMVSVSHGTDHAMLKTEKHESIPAAGS